MQPVCVALQEPAFEHLDPQLPRAYYTSDERYYNAATDEQVRVCAMFVDALGSALFGYHATITGLVGVPGTNKSTMVDCLRSLVGGRQYTFDIDHKHDK